MHDSAGQRRRVRSGRGVPRITAGMAALVLLLVLVPGPAAGDNSLGQQFWLAFPENFSGNSLSLFITGPAATNGTVEIPGIDFTEAFTVTPGTVTTVSIPTEAQLSGSDSLEAKGIHVTAAEDITVYGLNQLSATTDAYLGLPVDVLDTEYLVMAYTNSFVLGTQLAVVATQDDTTVTITPSADAGSGEVMRAAGVPFDVTMDAGDTYQLRAPGAEADLTGSLVSADRPIAMYGGHQCGNVPAGITACDHLVEQLFPTSTWGRSFVTMPLASRALGDTFRMLAQSDGTIVQIDGDTVATLDRGEFHEQVIVDPAEITATEPLLVAQYANGQSFDGTTGDPFQMLVPPLEQFLPSYTVTTPASGFETNFLNLVVRDASIGQVTVDGIAVPADSYEMIGDSGFWGAQVEVALGSHVVVGPQAFGLFVYGFNEFDSYGYPGGLSLSQVALVTDIALFPATASNPIDSEHCLTAIVTDQDGQPVSGVRVDFVVAGPNPAEASVPAGAGGLAVFCYTGHTTGTDQVTATVGSISGTATATWTTPTDPDDDASFIVDLHDLRVEEGDDGLTEAAVTATVTARPADARTDFDIDLLIRISGVNAVEGSDFQGATGFQQVTSTMKIPAGETAASIALDIIGNEEPEPNKVILATILDVSPSVVEVRRDTATVTIVNDDPAPDLDDPSLAPVEFDDTCLVDTDGLGLVKSAPLSTAEIALGTLGCSDPAAGGTVLIGRDDDFADSLSSGLLQRDAPLLLVPGDGTIPPAVADALRRLRPQQAIILGGTAAISEAVEQQLRDRGMGVVRRDGPTRIETAIDVAVTDAPDATTAIVARGFPGDGDPTQAFADAIAAGGMAADLGYPVLLTQTDTLTDSTATYLRDSDITDVFIMGGTVAVSTATEEQINAIVPGDVVRVADSDRFGTAVEVAKARGSQSAADVAQLIMIEGQGESSWAAGLTAAHQAAKDDAPIVLLNGGEVPQATAEYLIPNATRPDIEGRQISSDFALANDDVGVGVITCAGVSSGCHAARRLLGLDGTTVTFDPPSLSPVAFGRRIGVTFTDPIPPDADVLYSGSCLFRPTTYADEVIVRDDQGGPPLPCLVIVTITYPSGVVQRATAAYVF